MIMQITFTPIQFVKPIESSVNKPHVRLAPLKSDTVSFSARNFLAQPEDEIIAKIIKSVKNEKNCLGVGSEAEVFQVEGTNYCVRLPYGNIEDDAELISYFSDFDLNVNDEDKVNHVVARLGNGATLMRKINGCPVVNVGMNTIEAFSSLIRVSQLPQTAYCNLLRQIAEAYKKDMMFDPYGTNVIADTQNMTAIDFYKKQSSYKDDLSPLRDIYDALVAIKNPPVRAEKNIIKKIYNSALIELAPNNTPCLEPEEFEIYKFTVDLLNDKKINDEEFDNLWGAFIKVSKYKELELAGYNASPELEHSIEHAKAVLDKVF